MKRITLAVLAALTVTACGTWRPVLTPEHLYREAGTSPWAL